MKKKVGILTVCLIMVLTACGNKQETADVTYESASTKVTDTAETDISPEVVEKDTESEEAVETAEAADTSEKQESVGATDIAADVESTGQIESKEASVEAKSSETVVTSSAEKSSEDVASSGAVKPSASTENAASSSSATPSVAPETTQSSAPTTEATPSTPEHTHVWTETDRSEVVDCAANQKTISINYSCSCNEGKTEATTATAGCDWQWVGEWQYDFSGCVKSRATYHTCVTHGSTTTEAPIFERVDEHNYVTTRIEPSCETKGETVVICSKCQVHFPDKQEIITSATYPDGGGNGHNFVETGRSELNENETKWYGENKVKVSYSCTACGESYNDVIDK